MKSFILAAGFALVLAKASAQTLPTEKSFTVDPSNCFVVAPAAGSNAIVDYAVSELTKHLKLITGVDLPVAGAAQPGKFSFYVGIRPVDDTREFATEEGRWRITPTGVWLYGRDEIRTKKGAADAEGGPALAAKNQAGTLFAVYEFLEGVLGVRWIEPGDAGIAYSPRKLFEFAPSRGDWTPQLVQRHMRTAYKDTMRETALREGNVPAPMQFTAAEFAERQHDEIVWQRRMRMGGDINFTYGHAFREWWAKYGQTHPEYFALGKNGRRGPESEKTADRVKMCVSNPDLIKQIVKDHFDAHRGLVVNACENDSRNFCRCAACQALDVVLPGEENLDVDDRVLTDRYVHFANAIEREAKKYDPAAKTVFYAYSRYNLPPRREKLDDGIILFLLPNLAMSRPELEAYYRAWKDANAKEVYLRPNDLCQDTGLPLGFEQHMFMKYELANQSFQLRGTDYDTCWGFWPVSGITNYIMARGFYRPERSFADWNNEYCATYGAAQGDIAAYYDYWRQIWNKRVMGNLPRINAMTGDLKLLRNKMANLADLLYSESDFDATDAILHQASARDLTPQERSRLEGLILANQHNRLTYRATAANRVASTVSPEEQKKAAQALYDFRRQHRLELNVDWEQVFYLENVYEDNAGIERLLGTESKKMRELRLAADRQVAAARPASQNPLR